jgi:hypothetical protein
MFRCDVCDSVSPPNTPPQRITIETRDFEHPYRAKAHWHPPKGGQKGKYVDDPGGTGNQIVRELEVCAECAAKSEPRPPP